MVCIHGLNEENCPICRLSKHTYPNKFLQNLKNIENPLRESLEQSIRTDFKKPPNLKKKLTSKNSFFHLRGITSFSKAPFINELPEFKNTMFIKRMNEIDINNPNKYQLSKKIPLESPDWKLKTEQKKNPDIDS
jgi:hypothetical protein